jgi:hypothetical protein
MAAEEDPREKELREVSARLKELHELLKNKHTPQTIKEAIAQAEERLGDPTEIFIHSDGKFFKGTQHIKALIHLSEALDLRVKMGARHPLKEFERLLERKIALTKELNGL